MRIEGKYYKHGYFWLPEEKDNMRSGILSIYDGGKAELEIIGNFDKDNKFGFFGKNDDTYLKRIIGFIEEDGIVTLENCFYVKKIFPPVSKKKSKILANRVLSGAEWALMKRLHSICFLFL